MLRKDGPGVVRAGDIQTSGDIQILNPEHVICTLDEGAGITSNSRSPPAREHVSAERNRPERCSDRPDPGRFDLVGVFVQDREHPRREGRSSTTTS